MKKIYLSVILTLMATMGARAVVHTGVTLNHEYMSAHFASPYVAHTDSLAFNCGLVNNGTTDITHFSDTKLEKDLPGRPTTVGGYMSNDVYEDYRQLNPDAASTDYFVMTKFYITGSRGYFEYFFEGYFSGFYDKDEMVEALDAVWETMTYKVDEATLAGYKEDISRATIADARSVYENRCALVRQYDADKREEARQLAEAKAEAIAALHTLVDDCGDVVAISTGNQYIAAIEAATVIDDVIALRSDAVRIIHRLLTEPNAFAFGFIGTGNPIETQHAMPGLKMTFSEDGEEMTVMAHGADVTYPLTQVSGLSYFRGTPTISLSTSQNPKKAGEYLTTFHSGLEAYTIPEGVTAYTAEVNADQTAVILTAVEGDVLPQNEAVLLYTDEADPIRMEAVVSNAEASLTNQLRGTDVRDLTPANCMALNTTAGAFQRYTGTYFPANKAYLVHSAQAPLRVVFAEDVDSTPGIVTGLEQEASVKGQGASVKVLRQGVLYIINNGRVYSTQGVLVE